MTTPVSGIQSSYQPIGAYPVYNAAAQQVKAGHFVVNPPSIRPYSFYEDLKKGDNYFNEVMTVFASKKMPPDKTKTKKKNIAGKLIFWTTALTACIIAYKKRDNIAALLKNFKK